MKTTTGTITATLAANGVTHVLTESGPDQRAIIAVSGTFTGVTIVAEGKIFGGSVWYPLLMTDRKNGDKGNGQSSPTNSTATSWAIDCSGMGTVRMYASAGTPTAIVTEIASGTTEEFGAGAPNLQLISTANSAFAAGITFSGATTVNVMSIPDNLADALSISEAGNEYLTFVTTNGSERVDVFKKFRYADSVLLAFGDADDITMAWDGTDFDVLQATANSSIKWGISGAGIDHVFYGDTATRDLTWDQSADELRFEDNTKLSVGTGSDIVFSWDATRLNVTQAAINSEIRWGIDGAGIDQRWYGDTASAYLLWDQSADTLELGGVAKIKAQTIVAATGTAIPVTHSGSFPITQNGAETNTLADPSFIGQWLSIFVDTDTSGARVITAASRINQAANTIITLTEVGDFIKLEAITIAGALKWEVVSNDGAVLSGP